MCDIINIRVFCFVTPTLATCSAYRCATVYCICCSLNALEGFVGGVCLLGTRDTTNNPDCYCVRLMWVHDRLLPLVHGITPISVDGRPLCSHLPG